MKWLAAVAAALLLLLPGCALFDGQQAPVQEPAVEPAAQPQPAAQVVPFDPASLCGKQFKDYSNKVFSVRPCTTGTSYVLYRECCGQPPAFVDIQGNEVSGDAAIAAACTYDAGENICAKTLETEPMLCPAYAIASCPAYSSPVCAKIREADGSEYWFDYTNDCQACRDGKVKGGEVTYVRGECASRGIDTKSAIEERQKAQVYETLVGSEITLYAQHYGLAGREVKMTIEKADIKYVDAVTYNGQNAWRATVTDFAGNEEHSVYLYLDAQGKNVLGQEQNY